MTRIETVRRIASDHAAATVDGFWVDATTARALVMVYDALAPANRDKFERIPLPRLVDFTWKHIRAA